MAERLGSEYNEAERQRVIEAVPLDINRVRKIGGEVITLSVLEQSENYQGEPEIFDTIQGEGRNIGHHTAFVRLSECNQHCNFCDTAFTWAFKPELGDAHDDGRTFLRSEWQTQREVTEVADRVFAANDKSVVITGGEPMMQQAAVTNLIKELRKKNPDYHAEIETAGTLAPTDELAELLSQINVSPKLSSSGNDIRKSLKERPLKKLAEAGADFKFVVTSQQDIDEILMVVEMAQVSPDHVYLMPEGRTPEEIQRHGDMIADLCKEHGFNLTTRLHVLLWGDKKNV